MAKRVYTEKDILKWLEEGKSLSQLPDNIILTPSAKDLVNSQKKGGSSSVALSAEQHSGDPILPDYTYRWEEREDPKTPEEIRKFFVSPEMEKIKKKMCEIGSRMWQKDYTDGNGGNLLVRVGENLFLTTQTLICKGFMTPETISLVDFEGNQLAGKFKRTSECLTHLAIYKKQPKARATCHAHPPHATAYAVAGVQPPTCMIPEAEVFLGQIGMADYRTPGTPENAAEVGRVAVDHHSILMINHGVITWGDHIEDAYWKMENTDAYCKTVWIASQLGSDLKTITTSQARDLLNLRKSLGMDDKRENWKECELCDNSEFQPGVVCSNVPSSNSTGSAASINSKNEADALVEQITNMIMKELEKE